MMMLYCDDGTSSMLRGSAGDGNHLGSTAGDAAFHGVGGMMMRQLFTGQWHIAANYH